MKTRIKIFIVISTLLFACCLFTLGCSKTSSKKVDNSEETYDNNGFELVFDDDIIGLYVGQEFRITPNLSYYGENIQASLRYSLSTDNFIKIDNDGNITALGIGTTVLTVTANPNIENVKEITKKLTVNVYDEKSVRLSENNITLYSIPRLNGDDFVTEKKITSALYNRNQLVENDDVVWKSNDESICTVNNGVITSHKVGNTVVSAIYKIGTEEYVGYVNVTVEHSVTKYNKPYAVCIQNTSLEGFFGNEKEVLAVKECLEDDSYFYTVNDQKLSVTEVSVGEHNVIIYNDEYGYEVDEFVFADYGIYDLEDYRYFVNNSQQFNTSIRLFATRRR